MRRVCVVFLAFSLALSAVFLVLNSACPMLLHGPSYVIQRTQGDIRLLSAAVEFYRLDHHDYPEALTDLVEKELIYALYPDRWGSDYNYRVEPDGADFVIYSSGPNRVDEFGGGDDVMLSGKEYGCPVYYRCPTFCERVRDVAFIGAVVFWPVSVLACMLWGCLAGFRYVRDLLR